MINKIICWFKGHVGLTRDTEYVRHYIEIPAGRGAFCRDPKRYESNGRLYKCSRCGELFLHRGICSWEIEDLITVTLQDLPVGLLLTAFDSSYEFTRLFTR